MKEEKAIVLDFLPNGYPFDQRPMHMKSAVAQAIGNEHFIILELVPKKGVFLKPNEEVYMGEGKRDKIHHIVGRIDYDKLTETAKLNLGDLIEDLIEKHEQRFVDFFNKAGPINTRRHMIELVPGIGKKHMWEILEERKKDEFKSFSDMKGRVKLLPDLKKSLFKRIVMEMKSEDKYRLFVGA